MNWTLITTIILIFSNQFNLSLACNNIGTAHSVFTIIQTQVEKLPIRVEGMLEPGGSFKGLDGIEVSASIGAIEEPAEIFIERVDDPTGEHPINSYHGLPETQIYSPFYKIGALGHKLKARGNGKNSFEITFPLPEGLTADDVVVMSLTRAGAAIDHYIDPDKMAWHTIDRSSQQLVPGKFSSSTFTLYADNDAAIYVLINGNWDYFSNQTKEENVEIRTQEGEQPMRVEGTLESGSALKGPDGIEVSASIGAIEEPAEIFIERVDDPTTEYPMDLLADGSSPEVISPFYRIGAVGKVLRSRGMIFLSFPLSEGLSFDDVAVMRLSKAKTFWLDAPEPERYFWMPSGQVFKELVPGKYPSYTSTLSADDDAGVYVLIKVNHSRNQTEVENGEAQVLNDEEFVTITKKLGPDGGSIVIVL